MKNRKKLKGMTLVECIVALAVMAVMTTAMASAAAALGTIKVNTNDVIRKNSLQSTLADNKISGKFDSDSTYKIRITSAQLTSTEEFTARKNTAQQIDANDTSSRNYQYYDNIQPTP